MAGRDAHAAIYLRLGYEDNRYNHNFTVCTEKPMLRISHLPPMVEVLLIPVMTAFLPAFSVVRETINLTAAVILPVAALTDWFDSLARLWKQTSDFGTSSIPSPTSWWLPYRCTLVKLDRTYVLPWLSSAEITTSRSARMDGANGQRQNNTITVATVVSSKPPAQMLAIFLLLLNIRFCRFNLVVIGNVILTYSASLLTVPVDAVLSENGVEEKSPEKRNIKIAWRQKQNP